MRDYLRTKLQEFPLTTLQKADTALSASKVAQDVQDASIWWVQSQPEKRYRVQIIGSGHFTCSCPNGQVTGSSPQCYHLAAVITRILEQEDSTHDH